MSKRIIKKYANRRLYDTEDSRYVTLKDIKNIIALGTDVSIVDDTNGDDITRALLLQIVSEQELGGDCTQSSDPFLWSPHAGYDEWIYS